MSLGIQVFLYQRDVRYINLSTQIYECMILWCCPSYGSWYTHFLFESKLLAP